MRGEFQWRPVFCLAKSVCNPARGLIALCVFACAASSVEAQQYADTPGGNANSFLPEDGSRQLPSRSSSFVPGGSLESSPIRPTTSDVVWEPTDRTVNWDGPGSISIQESTNKSGVDLNPNDVIVVPTQPLQDETTIQFETAQILNEMAPFAERAQSAARNRSGDIYVEKNGRLFRLKGVVTLPDENGDPQENPETGERFFRVDEKRRRAQEMGILDTGESFGVIAGDDDVSTSSDPSAYESTDGSVDKGYLQRNLLGTPREANDLFFRSTTENKLERLDLRLGDGQKLALANRVEEANKAVGRVRVTPAFGVAYETNVPAKNFNVNAFQPGVLQGAGQSEFISLTTKGQNVEENLPFTMNGDVNLFPDSVNQTQAYVELQNFTDVDELDLSHGYVRIWNKAQSINLLAGKTHSMFGTSGYAVPSLTTGNTLIGTGQFSDRDDNRVQLRMHGIARSFIWGVAVEDPFDDDVIKSAATDQDLQRWPTFAGNVIWLSPNEFDRLQLAAMVRSVGFDNAANQEFFSTGWGVSLNYRRLLQDCVRSRSEIYCAVATGDGLGQYINGLPTSAAFDAGAGDLRSIQGYGGFIGFSRRWLTQEDKMFDFNLAYGYAFSETPNFLGAAASTRLQQGFANLLYYPTDQLAFGLEFQHGIRETQGNGAGINNRFFFVIAVTNIHDQLAKMLKVPTKESRKELADANSSDRQLVRLRNIPYEELIPPPSPGGYAYQQGF